MLAFRSVAVLAAAVSVLGVSTIAHADSDWSKSYPVSAKPSLTLTTGDASTEIQSCGTCREIRIHVEWRDYRASDYVLAESQTGNHVEFSLHQKMHFGMFNIGNHRAPHVTVETPQTVDLEARTSDGALAVSGIEGDLQLRISDGSLNVADVSGSLRLTSSDGSIRVSNASGTIESHSSDGSAHIAGRFSGVQVRSSDGSLDLTLEQGSKLTTASSIESSDGSVAVHLPRSLAADIDVHSSDGHVACNLPLTMDGYNTSSVAKNGLRGKLNGGGVPLSIQTHDGNARIDPL